MSTRYIQLLYSIKINTFQNVFDLPFPSRWLAILELGRRLGTPPPLQHTRLFHDTSPLPLCI